MIRDAIFSTVDLLLPTGCALERWSVVACDQFTSEPEYWERVVSTVGDAPSALHMILPEAYFTQIDHFDASIAQINKTMEEYLARGLFKTYSNCYLYLERTLADGNCRKGLIGKIDLEAYSYQADSQSPIRPTEGTVESRLPPRIRVRENAPLELPHVMLLLDDSGKTVLEPLAAQLKKSEKVYDFTLMEQGGRLRGWALSESLCAQVDASMEILFAQTPSTPGQAAVQIAVGDGNHSLATAKACYERLKATLPESEWKMHPARWALVELVNLHDPALAFEPIHRIVTGVQPQKLLEALCTTYPNSGDLCKVQKLVAILAGKEQEITLGGAPYPLTVDTLQRFLDAYLQEHGGEIDYIHGDDTLRRLVDSDDKIGFLLPGMEKSELFSAVREGGALPRKTFSMGHARDKRYYLEARKIQP